MKSWKRKSRHQRKVSFHIWKENTATHTHVSKWALNRFGRKSGCIESALFGYGHRSWRKEQYLEKKRMVNRLSKALAMFKKYPYFSETQGHPCKVIELQPDYTWYQLNVKYENLIEGHIGSLSYFLSGIKHLTEDDYLERIQFFKEYGNIPYILKYTYPNIDHIVTCIRFDMGRAVYMQEHITMSTYATDAGWLWMCLQYGVDIKTLEPMTYEELKACAENDSLHKLKYIKASNTLLIYKDSA